MASEKGKGFRVRPLISKKDYIPWITLSAKATA